MSHDAPLEKPDLYRCQAEKPGNGPFVMGGEIGDPRNGYRVRCRARPVLIAKEINAGSDGKRGSMSLCEECCVVMVKQMGMNYCSFTKIDRSEQR